MNDARHAARPEDGAGDQLASALTRCSRGDRAALRLVYESEGGRLVRLAERILRRRDLAEEVVQEAFVVIWTKAHQYREGEGSARGWIYAIVRNRALNMLRDGRREDSVPDEELDLIRTDAEADDALRLWTQLDDESRLRDCLAGLDETKRRCILMAYVSGYTHGEIAGRLRAPLGSVKAWIRRGLASLRGCMA